MNLEDLPQELLIARGMYASVRSAHEDAKKEAQILCGALAATSSQVLRAVQPDDGAVQDAEMIAHKLGQCRGFIDGIEACAKKIEALAIQRAALKPQAWPKR